VTRLRAAPHVHSDWSYDGSWTLEGLARLFGRLGYDAVLMAEHDRGFDEDRWGAYREACAAASAASGVLIVPGIEYSDAENRIHLPVWGEGAPFLGEGVGTGELMRRVSEVGASAVLAHPARRGAAEAFEPEWADALLGVEWWNRKYDGYAPGPVTGRSLGARGAIPFVGIDFHTARQLMPLAMVLEVDARGAGPAAVFGALRERRCRPEAFGLPALRFTGGRGFRAVDALETTRKRVARMVR
jgi:hypothetical protein